MTSPARGRLYFRLVTAGQPDEEALVRASGRLWGKARSAAWGNGPPAVKAFLGRLPSGMAGYTFSTDVEPTRTRMNVGMAAVQWEEGSPGVAAVPSHPGYVAIAVEVLDNADSVEQ